MNISRIIEAIMALFERSATQPEQRTVQLVLGEAFSRVSGKFHVETARLSARRAEPTN